MVYKKSTSVCETEGGGASPTSGHQSQIVYVASTSVCETEKRRFESASGNQVTMSENKGTKTKLADRIRKHAEAHPNDKGPQEIVAKLDAIRAELLKE